jgi:hypothetical protein
LKDLVAHAMEIPKLGRFLRRLISFYPIDFTSGQSGSHCYGNRGYRLEFLGMAGLWIHIPRQP